MPPVHVVIIKELFQSCVHFRDRLVSLNVNIVILDRPPQPFNEYVINGPPFAVHTDRDLCVLQDLDELRARELAPLIRVKHLGLAVLQRLFETFDAKIRRQCVR